jgi:Polyketide cyclase / dehydrase and lipid transport
VDTAMSASVPGAVFPDYDRSHLSTPGALMAQASATIDVSASPGDVWRLIGGFGSVADWLPDMTASRLAEGGRVRWLGNVDGETYIERLVAFDNDPWEYCNHKTKTQSTKTPTAQSNSTTTDRRASASGDDLPTST